MTKNKTFTIFLAFLAMGFGDVVAPLVSLVKDSFEVSNFVASLITTSGFIMFGVLSIPLGVYQDKKGKKFIRDMTRLTRVLVEKVVGSAVAIPPLKTANLLLFGVLLSMYLSNQI